MAFSLPLIFQEERYPRQPLFQDRRRVGVADPHGAFHVEGRAGSEHDTGFLQERNAEIPRCHGQIEFQQGRGAGFGFHPGNQRFPVDPFFQNGKVAAGDPLASERPAAREDVARLYEHLEKELDAAGYFFPPEMRETMTRNIRVALTRVQFTEGEVRTLRGVVKTLAKRGAASDHER